MAWRKNPTGLDQSVKKFLEDIRHHLATLIHGAGQFIRRDRVASIAAGLVLIGLLGGVIASTWLAHRAKLANAQAEHPSKEVRRLDHSRHVNYYDGLYNLASAPRKSDSPMKDALASYVRQDLADVSSDVGSATDGDRNTPLRTAVATSDEFVADNPRDRTYGRTFPMSYPNFGGAVFPTSIDLAAVNLTGDYLALIQKPQAAIVAFQKQIAIDEASVAADPGNVLAQTDLAYSSSRIGDLLTELGDPAGALPYYQNAVDIYTENAATGLPDPANSLHLSLLLGKLAQVHARLGYADKAVAEINKAADLIEALPVDAANVEQQHARALVYGELGDAYSLLARDTRTPQKFMKQFWRAAHDMYAHSLEILGILRDQGVLNADGLTEIDTISHKIAESDVFLVK